MKTNITSLIIAGILGTTLASQAAVVYLIDIDGGGHDDTPTSPAQSDGNFWNQFGDGLTTVAATTLQDTTGSTSAGVQIAITDAFGGASAANAGGETVYIPTATSDFIFSDSRTGQPAGEAFGEFTFSGLDATGITTYNIDIFGSSIRSLATDPQISEYIVTGLGAAVTQPLTHNQNTSNISSFVGVTANALGEITIGVQNNGSDDFGIVSVISLTAVPEPSSAVLLGLGGFALILHRRK